MPEENILREAERITTGSRRDAYGPPRLDYERTAALVSAMLAHKLKEPIDWREMMLIMIQVKISREINRHGRDNLVDIAGYANCIDTAAKHGSDDDVGR